MILKLYHFFYFFDVPAFLPQGFLVLFAAQLCEVCIPQQHLQAMKTSTTSWHQYYSQTFNDHRTWWCKDHRWVKEVVKTFYCRGHCASRSTFWSLYRGGSCREILVRSLC